MISNGEKELLKAKKGKYAIPHFNVLDANYIKNVMVTADKLGSPVFIAVSAQSTKYIGGYKTFARIVKSIDKELKIKVPVMIHLDHGTYEQCLEGIKSGFTSVMFDGSKISIQENVDKVKYLLSLASKKNISLEAEVGSIGGEEDGVIGSGERADINECIAISKLKIASLAAGLNTIHGKYPKDWTGIDFKLLAKIQDKVSKPLVLHGGSGIPEDQIKKAIANGIAKFNVGTALQVSFGEGVEKYIKNPKLKEDKKWYDPRKIAKAGFDEANAVIEQTIKLLGSGSKY